MMPTAVFKTKRVVMLYVFILVALALNACSINKEKREIARIPETVLVDVV